MKHSKNPIISALDGNVNTFVKMAPSKAQAAMIFHPAGEVLAGGSTFGGKSVGLLIAASMFLHVPGYNGLIARKTYSQLVLPGALIDLSMRWWKNDPRLHWDGTYRVWRTNVPSSLTFQSFPTPHSRYDVQGSQYQQFFPDELTQFDLDEYEYVLTRLRRSQAESDIPVRVLATANPGGRGHDWVSERFSLGRYRHSPLATGRAYLPFGVQDNPFVDETELAAFKARFDSINPVLRKQLLDGDWLAGNTGDFFPRDGWSFTDDDFGERPSVRAWDLASTPDDVEGGKRGDFTVGIKLTRVDDRFVITDIVRGKWAPREVDERIRICAEMDGAGTRIVLEQEPGSAGVAVADHIRRNVVHGYSFRAVKSTGSKIDRAHQASAYFDAGRIKMHSRVDESMQEIIIDELDRFPFGEHDDITDALTLAVMSLSSYLKVY